MKTCLKCGVFLKEHDYCFFVEDINGETNHLCENCTTGNLLKKANETQHGGDHYKNKTIQPWDYIAANNLDFFQGSAIKYITRFREKNGEQDLRKAIHFIEKLIEVEYGKD